MSVNLISSKYDLELHLSSMDAPNDYNESFSKPTDTEVRVTFDRRDGVSMRHLLPVTVSQGGQ